MAKQGTLPDEHACAALLGIMESDLLAIVQRCSKRELQLFYRLGLVCRCEWLDGHGYGLRSASCNDDGIPSRKIIPCTHTPETTFPEAVCSVILARLWPKDYGELAADNDGSDACSYRDCLDLRIARARRRKALWHAADAQVSDGDGLDDRLSIQAVRDRNGDIRELGVVDVRTLNGDDYEKSSRPSEKRVVRTGLSSSRKPLHVAPDQGGYH